MNRKYVNITLVINIFVIVYLFYWDMYKKKNDDINCIVKQVNDSNEIIGDKIIEFINPRREHLHEKLYDIYNKYKDDVDSGSIENCNYFPSKELAEIIVPIVTELMQISPSSPLNIDGLENYFQNVYPYSLKVETLDCNKERYRDILTGEKKESPGKLIFLSLFSYEFDLLEIKLYEYMKIMDHMILLESNRNNRGIRKPLGIFDENIEEKRDVEPRYQKFKDKIIHFIQDDSDQLPYMKNTEWIWGKRNQNSNFLELENNANRLLSEKLKKLKETLDLNDNDVFAFTDLDEFPDYELLFSLKYCKIKENATIVGDNQDGKRYFKTDLHHHINTKWPFISIVNGYNTVEKLNFNRWTQYRAFFDKSLPSIRIELQGGMSYHLSSSGGWDGLLFKHLGKIIKVNDKKYF